MVKVVWRSERSWWISWLELSIAVVVASARVPHKLATAKTKNFRQTFYFGDLCAVFHCVIECRILMFRFWYWIAPVKKSAIMAPRSYSKTYKVPRRRKLLNERSEKIQKLIMHYSLRVSSSVCITRPLNHELVLCSSLWYPNSNASIATPNWRSSVNMVYETSEKCGVSSLLCPRFDVLLGKRFEESIKSNISR